MHEWIDISLFVNHEKSVTFLRIAVESPGAAKMRVDPASQHPLSILDRYDRPGQARWSLHRVQTRVDSTVHVDLGNMACVLRQNRNATICIV